MDERTLDFLRRHALAPDTIEIGREARAMAEDMRAGLCGETRSTLMIPTYLSNDGSIPVGSAAAVIDAGGTNFRSAAVRFEKDGCRVEGLAKAKMPGTDAPCTWDEFTAFTAGQIAPLMDKCGCIGFCFSYSAEITPEMDGRVNRIDKEVVVTGSEGQLIGASLTAKLEQRGIRGKKVVVLNDTVAALLGGAAILDKSAYGGFIGQVSGTGTNTCVSLPRREIKKLGLDGEQGMIVNAESGMYDGIRGGDIDARLDRESLNPGSKIFEKLTAGAYLGELCRLALLTARDEGLFSGEGAERLHALEKIDGANVDAWARGEELELLGGEPGDGALARELCRALLLRSARCMCVNLLALGLLIAPQGGKPICVCAEGSLVQRCGIYREELQFLLAEHGARMGLRYELRVGEGTTLPGSAAAALLNL